MPYGKGRSVVTGKRREFPRSRAFESKRPQARYARKRNRSPLAPHAPDLGLHGDVSGKLMDLKIRRLQHASKVFGISASIFLATLGLVHIVAAQIFGTFGLLQASTSCDTSRRPKRFGFSLSVAARYRASARYRSRRPCAVTRFIGVAYALRSRWLRCLRCCSPRQSLVGGVRGGARR